MSIRIYEVINTETGKAVMTLQGKQKRTMEGAVKEYVRIGRLPAGEYRVELVKTEAVLCR